MKVPQLVRLSDGNWGFTYYPSTEDTVAIKMAVDGKPTGTAATLTITGRSPLSVDASRSIGAATLQAQGLKMSEPLDTTASSVIFMQESSVATVPAYDVFGSSYPSDPGLRVRLALVPAALEAKVLSAYRLPAPGTTTSTVLAAAAAADASAYAAAGRRLQQAYTLPPPPAATMTNEATGWLYLDDYEDEPPNPWAFEPSGAPAVFAFERPTADAGSPVQDLLGAQAGVQTFSGARALARVLGSHDCMPPLFVLSCRCTRLLAH
jgi:hypothetical protein